MALTNHPTCVVAVPDPHHSDRTIPCDRLAVRRAYDDEAVAVELCAAHRDVLPASIADVEFLGVLECENCSREADPESSDAEGWHVDDLVVRLRSLCPACQ